MVLVVLLFCVCIPPAAPQGWRQLSANITNVDFVSGAWSTPTTCVLVGYSGSTLGAIIRSTNAGMKWSTSYYGTASIADVAAASFTVSGVTSVPPPAAYVAVSTAGAVYVSADNGASFSVAASLAFTRLQGVAVGTNGNAYAAGSTTLQPFASKVYRASLYQAPSFSAWTDISPSPATSNLLNAVATHDGQTVIAVGYQGAVYYSGNNGTTWSVGSSGVTSTLQCVSSGNVSVAMAGGDGTTILLTVNGGATWTTIATSSSLAAFSAAVRAAMPPAASFRFHALSMVSPSVAYAAASSVYGYGSGIIIRTINGGASWTLQFTAAAAQSIYSVAMMNAYVGVAGFSKGGQVAVRTMGKNAALAPAPAPAPAPALAPAPARRPRPRPRPP